MYIINIIFIICFIICFIVSLTLHYHYFYHKGYFEEKEKAKGGKVLFLLIKQRGHVYMHVFFVLTFRLFVCLFCFLAVSCKKFLYFLEFNNCVCKFDKIKIKIYKKKSFCEVIDSFVLLTYASLAASRTLLQRLLASLNFIDQFHQNR